MAGCLENKAAAQEALYNKYGRRMLAVCKRYIPDDAQAEDVFQEAWVKIFKSLHQYRGGVLEGWLRPTFVHYSINYYNRHYKKRLHQDIQAAENLTECPWPNALDSMTAQEIMQAVNQLPEGSRMVFMLHAIEGYDHQEIGQMLGISEGTSKSQLHRARHLLKNKLAAMASGR